jgi:hypothetical protein
VRRLAAFGGVWRATMPELIMISISPQRHAIEVSVIYYCIFLKK